MKKIKIFVASLVLSIPVLISGDYLAQAKEEDFESEYQDLNGEEIFELYEGEENKVHIEQDNNSSIGVLSTTPGGGGSALPGHYLERIESETKTIHQQDKEAVIESVSLGVLGGGFWKLGLRTVGAVTSAFGLNEEIGVLLGGTYGADFPITIRHYVYFAHEPTDSYAGYTVTTITNNDTGAVVSTDRRSISRY
ncbi:hypothetical protein [Alkalibacillus aidingensis]|uniref:hypothetical protein n=1 Tax=Alkalibacillus aidingensis TaxID=2747607 RepID=UPI0016610985|nr:hypothetical protein [Alkalibacillus aidingensis]